MIGYFRTMSGSFELLSKASGRTQVLEGTAHEPRLDTLLYWLLLARWAVEQNIAPLLLNLKRRAESEARGR